MLIRTTSNFSHLAIAYASARLAGKFFGGYRGGRMVVGYGRVSRDSRAEWNKRGVRIYRDRAMCAGGLQRFTKITTAR